MKKVNVTMPSYNCGAYIEDALNSVLSQDYANFNITVVDDGSTDNTEDIVTELAENHTNLTYIKFKNNGGVARARNLSLLVSDFDMITFQDSDDLMFPQKLSKQVAGFDFELKDIPEEFQERLPRGLKPFVDIVTCRLKITLVDGTEQEAGDILNIFYGIYPNVVQFNKPNSFIAPIISLYDKRVFEELGGFIQYRAGSDSEMKDRCLAYGMNIRHINEVLYHYIRRPVSVTSSTDKKSHEFTDMHKMQTDRANSMKSLVTKEEFLEKFQVEIDLQDLEIEKIINKQNLKLNTTIPATSTTRAMLQDLLGT